MKSKIFIFLLVLYSVCFISACKKEIKIANLSGTITDELSDIPISNAKIAVASKSAFSSEDGKYHLVEIPPGEYKLSLTKIGYKSITDQSVTLGANDNQISFKMQQLINVMPQLLVFQGNESEKTLQISYIGSDVISFDVVSSSKWCTVSPSTGNLSNQVMFITVKVDRNGLSSGTLTSTIAINSPKIAPLVVNCSMVIMSHAPTISTVNSSNVTSVSIASGGSVTSDGGAQVSSRGVCWSTSQNPTTANSKTTDGSGTGSFVSSITGLTPGTTYYIRAYATNSVGTSYGDQILVTTAVALPSITTTNVSSITPTTVMGGGTVTSDGGLTVTIRGVCWSTSQNPTTANSKTTDGSGTGSFVSSITGLTPGTTYYIRAYATNSSGTVYGNLMTVTTVAVLPTISTTNASSFTTTTAKGGGTVTSDGGSTVTIRGVCWSTSQNPTTANSKTTDGSGTGSFTSTIFGINNNITYYVRAYATNAIGTAYGTVYSVNLYMNMPGTPITDIDGNVYKTVRIGDQIWMAENLKVTKYRNGNTIPNVTDGTIWKNLTSGAWCDFSNSTTNGNIYGHLFNFYTVIDSRQLCPVGWHVPTDNEFITLSNYLGGDSIAGGKLKEAGTSHWLSPNTNANNSSGFTALAGSWRGDDGLFYYNVGFSGAWWSSSEFDANNGIYRGLSYNNPPFLRAYGAYVRKSGGCNIRCIKD